MPACWYFFPSGRWPGTSQYSCPARRLLEDHSSTVSSPSLGWQLTCHLWMWNTPSHWRTSTLTTPATLGTPATPPPRVRPLLATAVSPASRLTVGRAQRTLSITETPARAPRTRGYSGQWRKIKGGEWIKVVGWTLRRSSMNSWRTYNLITWLFLKVRHDVYIKAVMWPHFASDSGGLQLFLGPDGSVRFDQPSTLDTDYQPVLINNT